MKYNTKQLTDMANVVRAHALSAIQSADSGHIGIALGAADIVVALFANFIRIAKDKFVLSAGHGSALLYSVLSLAGYKLPSLNTFRKLGGLPGHPEYKIDGVSATTGPLGQGVGNAVGMALAAKLRKRDSHTFCLCSDGDLMEGVAQESIAFAGRYQLNNLVLLWDNNGLSIDGTALTDLNMNERMKAAGWQVFNADGNDFKSLNAAVEKALKSKKPAFVNCKTVLGLGSGLAGKAKAHGFALKKAELMKLIARFSCCGAGADLWRDFARNTEKLRNKNESQNTDFKPENLDFEYPDSNFSTRELSGIYLNQLLKAGVGLIGGSADLSESTNVKTDSSVLIKPKDFSGNFINYGVREHAMGAIMNGMAYVGLRPYGSTFLAFSDYLRPAIRLAALSEIPVIYVFSHDSVAVGEDGPTHQPIEQLASLRLIPNLNVFRPCNMEEVAFSWNKAVLDKDSPTCIVLSRQKIKQIRTPHGADISKGAYVIKPATSVCRVTLIATGSEVPLAISVAEKLGGKVQVVSMPSVADFRRQDDKYKKSILRGFVVAIEAGASASWFEFADAVIGIDSFGTSGGGEEVYKYFGFDADKIARDIAKKVKNV